MAKCRVFCTCGHKEDAHANGQPRLCGGTKIGFKYRCDCEGFAASNDLGSPLGLARKRIAELVSQLEAERRGKGDR